MILKKLLFLVLFLSSFSLFTDTYPATPQYVILKQPYRYSDTHDGACSVWGGTTTPDCRLPDNSLYAIYLNQYLCPGGGTVSGSSCINASPCVSPQVRNTLTSLCYTPLTCDYPETDNGNGLCQNNTCPVGQTRNPSTKLCQVAPTCGSKESYDIYSNLCKLYPLPCPGHTHANTANDTCLADAPLVCPTGQHDDGTYTCVADDAKGCKSNQQYGTINGISQCVTKANAEQAAKVTADSAANLAAKRAAEAVALANKNAAKADLDADPTNTAKQAAYSTATTSHTSAQTETQSAFSSYQEIQKNQDSETLKSIDQSLKGPQNPTIPTVSPTLLTDVQSAMGEAMQTNQMDGKSFVNTSSIFSVDSVTCQTVPMSYKSLNYTFNPCSKLSLFRTLLGWFCYVWTAFGIVSIARAE